VAAETGSLTLGADAGVTIGVIGTGNMGSALIRGWSRSPALGARLLVWDKIPGALERVEGCEGVVIAVSLAQLVAEAEVLVVVVKPKDAEGLLSSIGPLLREGQVVISSMAGVELRQIRSISGPRPALLRVMPNLGVEVGAGSVAIAAEVGVSPEVEQRVTDLFAPLGLTVMVPESMLDAVTAVSGTGPALLALALEGLEDGGVAAGLPRSVARAFARRAMLGAARMLVAGDDSAAGLRQRLVPPGDPLGEGVDVLEERGVRLAFQQAVEAASQRARQMRAPSGGGA
jgi:pyrroline-5-carboxylate reductase